MGCPNKRDFGFHFINEKLSFLENKRNAEAIARKARYAVFEEKLLPKGVLLTAHHQDDQAETLLLNLLRGSGIDGLTAMPERKVFGRGEHWRPWLSIRRATIEKYLQQHSLQAIEDPSNADISYRRNWLRHKVFPLLNAGFPNATDNIARSASLLGEVRAFTEQSLDAILYPIKERLSVSLLAQYSESQKKLLIRRWLSHHSLPMPSFEQLQEFLRQLSESIDGQAQIIFSGLYLFAYQGNIYFLEEVFSTKLPEVRADAIWSGIGRIKIKQAPFPLEECRWALYPPGERFRPCSKLHHKSLKEWFRLYQIPPLLRRRIPLLYWKEQLVWVGEIGNANGFEQLVIEWKKTGYADTISR